MARDISSMCQPFLFPLCQFREVLANPSHVADRLVLGPEDARSSVVNRYGEFKAVFGFCPARVRREWLSSVCTSATIALAGKSRLAPATFHWHRLWPRGLYNYWRSSYLKS